ncbi:MAG TPA: nitrilase family protein [Cyclobacteriaceae bacterium]
MDNLSIAAAQFQPKDGDKSYNLSVIEKLTRHAQAQGASVVSFHELSITAYTWLKKLNKDELLEIAEPVPNGKSCKKLIEIAKINEISILAGLVESEGGKIYNTYVCVDANGLVAKHRKLHPFISPYLSPGDQYTTFNLYGWKCGILICYDNNIIENVRATTLLGAQVIFAPHVTGCTPSSMPGRGFVDDTLWQKRREDPVPLRMAFDGPKGRAWLMRWLPARSFDNGVYYIFTNPIGYDGEQLKNGNAMMLDPYGELLSEIKSFDDGITVATLAPDKLTLSGGYRYRNARRPELYKEIIGKAHDAETKPTWLKS